MIKAILFDFNGVIINDEPLQMQAYKEVLEPEGIALSEKDYYGSLGMDDVTFLKAAFARSGKELTADQTTKILEQKTVAHRALIHDEIPFFPGVINLIKEARNHFKLGVVSMARRADIVYVLERADVLKDFDIIVSADDVSVCKPDPQCYNQGFQKIDRLFTAENKYPIVRAEVLVIEDAPPGVRAGKSAGMYVLGVTNTVAEIELRQAGADSVTKNLHDWTPETVQLVFR